MKRNNPNNRVVMTLSLDLTNSTKYKIIQSSWPIVFRNIFYAIEIEYEKIKDYNVWKYNGDEILLSFEIKTLNDIFPIIQQNFLIFKKACEMVEEKSEKIMSLKATVWLIPIIDNEISLNKNEFFVTKRGMELLGPNVDEGFRISHSFANKRQFVISFEIAFLLAHTFDSMKEELRPQFQPKFYFLGLQKLKGVWENLPYPIIYLMYDSKFSTSNIPLQEIEQNELLKKVFNIRWNGNYYLRKQDSFDDYSYNCKDMLYILNLILDDYEETLNLNQRIDELWDILK